VERTYANIWPREIGERLSSRYEARAKGSVKMQWRDRWITAWRCGLTTSSDYTPLLGRYTVKRRLK